MAKIVVGKLVKDQPEEHLIVALMVPNRNFWSLKS